MKNEIYLQEIINYVLKWKDNPIDLIVKKLGINYSENHKSIRHLIILKILNSKKNLLNEMPNKDELFFKTVLVNEKNSIQESFVLSKIHLSDFDTNKNFEETDFYKKINSKIIFFIFKIENNIEKLFDAFIFEFTNEQKENGKLVFEYTKKLFINGGIYNNENKNLNFIKQSSNLTFHVRPQAKNSYDVYTTQAGETITKQAFWLNKDVIESILKSINFEFETEKQNNFNETLTANSDSTNNDYENKQESKDDLKIKDVLKNTQNIKYENCTPYYKDYSENIYKDIKIENLNLSIRSKNSLTRNNIKYFSQLMNLKIEELKKIRNLGLKCYKEILKNLSTHTIFLTQSELDENLNFQKSEINNNQFIQLVIDFPKRGLSNKSKSILEYISEINQKKIYLIFKVSDIYYEDYEIQKINFSERTHHCLKDFKINTLKQLVAVPLNILYSIKNLGNTSLQEIFDWIQNNSIPIEKNENDYYLVINKFLANISNKYVQYTKNILCSIIWENTKNKKIGEINFENLSFIMDNNEEWNKYIDNLILWTIKSNNDRITFLQLQELIPELFLKQNNLMYRLDYLLQKKLIIYTDDVYYYKYPNFETYLSNLEIDEKKKQITLKRIMNGETLEKIAQEENLTRERIRQIVNKTLILKSTNKVWEDLFSNLFEEYDMNEESVYEILNLNKNSYNYLNSQYKKGTKKILHLISDENCESWIIKNAKKYIHKNYIEVDGEFIEKKKNNILKYLLRTKCSNEIHFDDFMVIYKNFLLENNIDYINDKFAYQERALSSRLLDSNLVLWKTGRKMRYYEVEKIDSNTFFTKLELNNYINKEISTKLIFDINSDLMNEYDILDEYELHNLMKKLYENSNKEIEINFTRMPIISIGKTDRDEQVKELLLEENPIKKEDFAEKYETVYGVKKESVLANFLNCIENYLDRKGNYVLVEEVLNNEELNMLSEVLNKNLYTMNQARKIFIEIFPNKVKYFNTYNLKKIGFSLSKNIIYKNEYGSLEKFIENYFKENKIVDFGGDFSILFLNRAFNQVIPELQRKYQIIEFDKNKYISIEKINEIGYSINEIKDFINKAIEYSEENFFTLFWLEKNEFEHKIFDMGFDSYFYENILRYDERIKWFKIGNTMVFKKDNISITSNRLISWFISSSLKMDVYDLLNILSREYNIKLEKNKLIAIARNVGLFYSEIKEKIYIDYDEYFKEID